MKKVIIIISVFSSCMNSNEINTNVIELNYQDTLTLEEMIEENEMGWHIDEGLKIYKDSINKINKTK